MLHTDRENQIATIDGTPHGSHSPRKVKADTSLLVRTQQKVSQDLAPHGQLTGRGAGPDGSREASPRCGPEAGLQGPHRKRWIRRGANGLNADLSALLSGQRGSAGQRSRQQQQIREG